MKIFIYGCIVIFCAASAAQSSPQLSSIPNEIRVLPDGTSIVKTNACAPSELDLILHRIPRSIPVTTVLPDGSRSPGYVFTNTSTSSTSLIQHYPASVVLLPDGTWGIEYMQCSLTHYKIKSGESYLVPGSESADIEKPIDTEIGMSTTLHDSAPHSNRAATIQYIYNHDGAPSGATPDIVIREIDEAVGAWRELLKDDDISVTFRFQWEALGCSPGNCTLAFATRISDDRHWLDIRNRLTGNYGGEDTDIYESNFQDY